MESNFQNLQFKLVVKAQKNQIIAIIIQKIFELTLFNLNAVP